MDPDSALPQTEKDVEFTCCSTTSHQGATRNVRSAFTFKKWLTESVKLPDVKSQISTVELGIETCFIMEVKLYLLKNTL